MNKRKKIMRHISGTIFAFVILAIFAAYNESCAKPEAPPPTSAEAKNESIPAYSQEFLILNSSDQDLMFFLSYDGVNWRSNNIKAGRSSTYQIKEYGECFVKITTGTELNSVIYKIQRQKKYKIYWNEIMKRWDFAEIIEMN